jgi:hypothetical protein
MTDIKVRQIINDQLTAAIATFKNAKCPHCGVAIGAAKVAKSKSVTEDFFDDFYGGPPRATLKSTRIDDIL